MIFMILQQISKVIKNIKIICKLCYSLQCYFLSYFPDQFTFRNVAKVKCLNFLKTRPVICVCISSCKVQLRKLAATSLKYFLEFWNYPKVSLDYCLNTSPVELLTLKYMSKSWERTLKLLQSLIFPRYSV